MRLPAPDVPRSDSGVPLETPWGALLRRLQPFLAIAFAIVCLVTVRPMGLTGDGLPRLLLVVVNLALALTVPVPDRVLRIERRLRVDVVMVLCAGALAGLAGQGWGSTFAYMACVHVGVRFAPSLSVPLAVLCGLSGVVVTVLVGPTSHNPWWASLLVVIALVPGMSRRTTSVTLAAADRAVEARALEERAGIARDIHDVLAHTLSGVNMQLSLADALLESGDQDAGRTAVRRAQSMVVTGLAEARSAVQTLRGDTVDPVAAVQRLLAGTHERFEVTGTPYAVPGRVAHVLVRTAQEALTNARRHAAGADVLLELAYDDQRVVLTVGNAAGEGPSDAGSGLGLVGMGERAEHVGGRLSAVPLPLDDPTHPGGWRVRLEVPRG